MLQHHEPVNNFNEERKDENATHKKDFKAITKMDICI